MSLLATLDGFFAARAPLTPGDGLIVAFSGGPDSSALLSGLAEWRRGRELALTAAHFDHGIDPGSSARAAEAARLAARLGIPFVEARGSVVSRRRRGECLEATARRLRYGFLERVRVERGARYVATAHHLDDQAETVLLRLRQGTGLGGLGSIAPRLGTIVRPILDVPRHQLARWLEGRDLEPVDDPTNRELARTRNRLRHEVLPALVAKAPELPADLARLAAAARKSRRSLDRRLGGLLSPRLVSDGVEIERQRLADLPAALLAAALAHLHRRAGAQHPPGTAVCRELARQLARGGAVGCDCGGGWTMVSRGRDLALHRRPLAGAAFAYTLTVPGEVELPTGNGTLRVGRQTARPWMFETSSWRAGLSLDLQAGDRITVRSRRPGDRIRPFGCSYDRRLKDVLIDRKVPRPARDRLPLLCIGRRVVWVPGVTIDEQCRLTKGERAWVAEWEQR